MNADETAPVCPSCDFAHAPELPHNVNSLRYQYAFRNTEARSGRGARWGTWADAMAHCTPRHQLAWTLALLQQGISI